jgi:hypothetical protein
MFNSLGMSESILQLIERRSTGDMLIFIGMAVLTIICVFVLFYYVKPMIAIW